MKFTAVDIKQGSVEWLQYRAGRVTGSRIADVCAKGKTGYSSSRANYAAQLVCERLTGVVEETFKSKAMQDGIDREAEARQLYAFRRDVEVAEVGFVDHPTIPLSGASPDGIVTGSGLLEIKAPFAATHIETMMGAAIPRNYHLQMQWQMAATGADWCDYASYHPNFPPDMRLFVRRVQRDQRLITEVEQEVRSLLAEVERTVETLKTVRMIA